MTASTTPPLSVWPCGPPGGWVDTRGLRPPSVRPNHRAALSRRRAPWDVPSARGEGFGIRGQGFGIPNRSPEPLVRRAGRDHPPSRIRFRYPSLPVLLEGKATQGGTRVVCHPRGKNYGDRTPPVPCVPHGGTPAALVVCLNAPSPLGVTRSSQSRGLASSSSCRVPNCPRQESICQSLEHQGEISHSSKSLGGLHQKKQNVKSQWLITYITQLPYKVTLRTF